jgi:hypothetical protein
MDGALVPVGVMEFPSNHLEKMTVAAAVRAAAFFFQLNNWTGQRINSRLRIRFDCGDGDGQPGQEYNDSQHGTRSI